MTVYQIVYLRKNLPQKTFRLFQNLRYQIKYWWYQLLNWKWLFFSSEFFKPIRFFNFTVKPLLSRYCKLETVCKHTAGSARHTFLFQFQAFIIRSRNMRARKGTHLISFFIMLIYNLPIPVKSINVIFSLHNHKGANRQDANATTICTSEQTWGKSGFRNCQWWFCCFQSL